VKKKGPSTMKTLEAKSLVLLKHHLKALRLPTVGAECEKVANQVAADNVDHLTYLLQLLELELLDREKRSADRRLKAAKFHLFWKRRQSGHRSRLHRRTKAGFHSPQADPVGVRHGQRRRGHVKEIEFIRALRSNDPAVGYNRWPRFP
jgi:hypothetical protein